MSESRASFEITPGDTLVDLDVVLDGQPRSSRLVRGVVRTPDVNALRRDMALAARSLLGPGYVDSYYFDISVDFVDVALDHIARCQP